MSDDPELDNSVQMLCEEVALLREVLESLISWMSQSAGSPINHMEAAALLLALRTGKPPK
jgi:hypothetical protein